MSDISFLAFSYLEFSSSRLQYVLLNLMHVANLKEHERVLGISSRMCSHPAGPDLQPKSRAN